MRKVMIGTPSYDGKLDVWYVNSLINTINRSHENNISVTPIWLSFDALIQRARNDIIALAVEMDVDDLVWIDSDIEWKEECFFELLNCDEDVVGGTYRKKTDSVEEYVFRDLKKNTKGDLMEVSGLGTGFVKFSKKAINYLWNTGTPYIDPKDGKERRMIFDVSVVDFGGINGLMGEDILVFRKLSDGNFKIWLNKNITCGHSGVKKYTGDFNNWMKSSFRKKQL